MKIRAKGIIFALLVCASAFMGAAACATPQNLDRDYAADIIAETQTGVSTGASTETQTGTDENNNIQQPEPSQQPEKEPQAEPPQHEDTQKTADYVLMTGTNVNIRAGAGTNYSSLGRGEKGTYYACLERQGGWIKTYYKNKVAYVSAAYCAPYAQERASESVERVSDEGCKLLGVKYVYGATRYHDGSGKRLSGFTAAEFDCSSLMQYIFKQGADVNLQVTTRTQVVQGRAVDKGALKRGDLMFFTNASRASKTGTERIGHVALYLGDNLILHTASDYAKIEPLTAQRWAYFITARRVI